MPSPVKSTIKAVDPAIVALLARAELDGPRLRISERLDAAVYRDVNKVLSGVGGAWNKKLQAHVFGDDAADAIEPILLTGTLTLPPNLGWFPTPAALAAELVARGGAGPGALCLEPSAGEGAIVKALISAGAAVDAFEIDAKRASRLAAIDHGGRLRIVGGDFLERKPEARYDHVVMNPPFAPGRLDALHVLHAYDFLRPAGTLVAVTAGGIKGRTDKTTARLLSIVEAQGGTIESLPEGSFKSSGTAVNTAVITITRRR